MQSAVIKKLNHHFGTHTAVNRLAVIVHVGGID